MNSWSVDSKGFLFLKPKKTPKQHRHTHTHTHTQLVVVCTVIHKETIQQQNNHKSDLSN